MRDSNLPTSGMFYLYYKQCACVNVTDLCMSVLSFMHCEHMKCVFHMWICIISCLLYVLYCVNHYLKLSWRRYFVYASHRKRCGTQLLSVNSLRFIFISVTIITISFTILYTDILTARTRLLLLLTSRYFRSSHSYIHQNKQTHNKHITNI